MLTRSVMPGALERACSAGARGRSCGSIANGFESWPTTVWNIPSSEIETRDHPTSKPARVFTLPMELHTRWGDLCYEPFACWGSQLIAGEHAGRRVYNVELSEAFCDVVVERWQAFTGQTASLDGDEGSFEEVKAERQSDRAVE